MKRCEVNANKIKSSRCTARWLLRHADIITYITKWSISNGEMYSTICVHCTMGTITLVLFNIYSSTSDKDMCKKRSLLFHSETLTFVLRFALPVTLVQQHIFTKLEVSTAFLGYFEKIRGMGQTDGAQHLMWSSWESSIILKHSYNFMLQ